MQASLFSGQPFSGIPESGKLGKIGRTDTFDNCGPGYEPLVVPVSSSPWGSEGVFAGGKVCLSQQISEQQFELSSRRYLPGLVRCFKIDVPEAFFFLPLG